MANTEGTGSLGRSVIPLPENVLEVLHHDFQFNHIENLFESLYSKYGSDVFMVMNTYLQGSAHNTPHLPEVPIQDFFHWQDTGLGADRKIDESLNYKVQGEDKRDEAGFDGAHNAIQKWGDHVDPSMVGDGHHHTVSFDPVSHSPLEMSQHFSSQGYTIHGAELPHHFELESFEQASRVGGDHLGHTLDGLMPSPTSVATGLEESVSAHLPPELAHEAHHQGDTTGLHPDPASEVPAHEAQHTATGEDLSALNHTDAHHKTE